MKTMRVAIAQIENRVGDLRGNSERILDAMAWAEDAEADALVLPELCLPGYPVGDLVNQRGFVTATRKALDFIAERSGQTPTILGTLGSVSPKQTWDTQTPTVSISAAILCNGELRGEYHKTLLPTYEIFEEGRVFAAGDKADAVWQVGDTIVGVAICEDLWAGAGVSPPDAQAAARAQILLVPNASPFYPGKQERRFINTARVARRTGLSIVYVNGVGGQDELVFEGGSFVVDGNGEVMHAGKRFEPDRFVLDVPIRDVGEKPRNAPVIHPRVGPARPPVVHPEPLPRRLPEDVLWQALVTGTRDFVINNGGSKVVLPWWNGINAFVTAAIAVDAFGADNVLALDIASEMVSKEDADLAKKSARALGIEVQCIEIDAITKAVASKLENVDDDARSLKDVMVFARQAVLLTIATSTERIPLATLDKTSLSIRAVPQYAERSGSFAPLRDCFKSTLYGLAHFRKEHGLKVPSALLGQQSQPILDDMTCEAVDAILKLFLEEEKSLDETPETTAIETEIIRGILKMVDDAEAQRRRVPIGPKVSRVGEGHIPITNAWRPHTQPEPPDVR